ncbi:MAG: acetyl-CoA decarbonylase/synthase complex subunit delta [Actinobacteria bacterium]|nr:acetyl-CoA decarbonylase/synthase complex subunit delta [Actinomycetota bacterium]MBU1492473.1 acetyl-CoA decarbonylase/synthase complex subunit delta [Actinomycetota bacterium]
MPVEIPKDSWPGSVNTVTLGATGDQGGSRTSTVTIGGEQSLPFMHFENPTPHRPVIAMEVAAARPADWSAVLLEAWGSTLDDPAVWARACEDAGADLIVLQFGLKGSDDGPVSAEFAVEVVKEVMDSTGLPLVVLGPGQAEIDNSILVPIADATKGERIVLGLCEEGNYRTIVAAAMANDHLVLGKTPMDVNLAKQLNILMTDMGLPLDRIVMDPTTGALGYGIEYGYSVMERLRLAALQGDAMTQLPMLVTPGVETWKTKESKVGAGIPDEWGEWAERGVNWETLTAVALIEAGADVVVLRHPQSLVRVRAAIAELTASETA